MNGRRRDDPVFCLEFPFQLAVLLIQGIDAAVMRPDVDMMPVNLRRSNGYLSQLEGPLFFFLLDVEGVKICIAASDVQNVSFDDRGRCIKILCLQDINRNTRESIKDPYPPDPVGKIQPVIFRCHGRPDDRFERLHPFQLQWRRWPMRNRAGVVMIPPKAGPLNETSISFKKKVGAAGESSDDKHQQDFVNAFASSVFHLFIKRLDFAMSAKAGSIEKEKQKDFGSCCSYAKALRRCVAMKKITPVTSMARPRIKRAIQKMKISG